jgi:excisionase family DNA binding protein
MDERPLTITEIGKILKIHRTTLREFLKQNPIVFYTLGRRKLYKLDDVLNAMKVVPKEKQNETKSC